MEQIYKDRLLKLAALLRADAANPKGLMFDLGTWGVSNTESEDGQIPLDCNTTGCAVGLAVLSGVFEDEGFTYILRYGNEVDPSYKGHLGFAATRVFFGLGYEASRMLFAGTRYDWDERRGAQGELAVANRIDGFVASDGKLWPDDNS